MRVAYLILAHANPKQLQRLVNRLSHTSVDFYIHIDLKVAIQSFKPLMQQPNTFFVKNREKVRWGAYSIVQATVNGFEQIIASGINYQHITLLSGQDYPLKCNSAILDFFLTNLYNANYCLPFQLCRANCITRFEIQIHHRPT